MNLIHGDCLEVMKTLPDNSVDAVVADPPYGLSFMGKKWDYQIPAVEVWIECLRILKPGGHALIACGTRTQHRMVCNIEDAGFEIRDVVSWIYGSGFPKSRNIGKDIEKIAVGGIKNLKKTGTKKGINCENGTNGYSYSSEYVAGKCMGGKQISGDIPTYEINNEWDGWGTALKPACEFFTLCRKPISEKTVAANVLKWGTGGINVDGCRVEGESWGNRTPIKMTSKGKKGGGFGQTQWETMDGKTNTGPWQGRFPANLVLSYPEEEYTLRDDVTPDQLRKLAEWME